MDILFGFAGRIGRLGYFMLSLALGVAMTLLTFAMVALLAPHYMSAAGTMPKEPPSAMLLIVVMVVGPIFLWFTLALQAKRFRDMGWAPLYVIPGWIAVAVLDKLVAALVPAAALASGDGTIVGLMVNLLMVGCLLFWPSAPGDAGAGFQQAPSPRTDRPRAPAPAAAPRAASGGGSPAAPAGFGRRGL